MKKVIKEDMAYDASLNLADLLYPQFYLILAKKMKKIGLPITGLTRSLPPRRIMLLYSPLSFEPSDGLSAG
jgi:hypothetical protein